MSDYYADERDSKRRWHVRSAAIAGSATFIAIVLWNAKIHIPTWALAVPHYAARVAPHRPKSPRKPPAPPVPPNMSWVHSGHMRALPKTPGRLLLVRTIPAKDGHPGKALIGTDPFHPQTYLAGAILASGARITQILPDRVVLTRGGQRVILYPLGAKHRVRLSSEQAALLNAGGNPRPIKYRRVSVDHISRYLRPVPVYQNGAVAGFEVYPGTESQAFHTWGFQPGDVVTAVDGHSLTGSDQMIALLSDLHDGETLTVTVNRGGKPVHLVVTPAAKHRAPPAAPNPPPPPQNGAGP